MSRSRAALLLAAFSLNAAGAPRIENVVVKPNPAAFSAGKPPEVEIVASTRATAAARGRSISASPRAAACATSTAGTEATV